MGSYWQRTHGLVGTRSAVLPPLVGFLLAALLALTVPGTSRDHVDPVFGPHVHDLATGQEVPLVDSRGHATRGATVLAAVSLESGSAIHAAFESGGIPNDLLAAGWLLLAAATVAFRRRPRDFSRSPAESLIGPSPPPPR